MADGSFIADFDPEFGKNFEAVPGYVEGTAWQYTFFTPHDMPGGSHLPEEKNHLSPNCKRHSTIRFSA
ncbi:MAG: glycoside hydrolase family 92 protein [Bacteroidia bacterium]